MSISHVLRESHPTVSTKQYYVIPFQLPNNTYCCSEELVGIKAF